MHRQNVSNKSFTSVMFLVKMTEMDAFNLRDMLMIPSSFYISFSHVRIDMKISINRHGRLITKFIGHGQLKGSCHNNNHFKLFLWIQCINLHTFFKKNIFVTNIQNRRLLITCIFDGHNEIGSKIKEIEKIDWSLIGCKM